MDGNGVIGLKPGVSMDEIEENFGSGVSLSPAIMNKNGLLCDIRIDSVSYESFVRILSEISRNLFYGKIYVGSTLHNFYRLDLEKERWETVSGTVIYGADILFSDEAKETLLDGLSKLPESDIVLQLKNFLENIDNGENISKYPD